MCPQPSSTPIAGFSVLEEQAVQKFVQSLIWDHKLYPNEWGPLRDRAISSIRAGKERGYGEIVGIAYFPDRADFESAMTRHGQGKARINLDDSYRDVVAVMYK